MGYSTKNTGCSVSLILLTVPSKESCWNMVFLGNRVTEGGNFFSPEPHISLCLPRFRQAKGNYGYLHGKPKLTYNLSVSMAAQLL